MSHDWGYGDDNGPAHWGEMYPVANGTRQSPIEIIPSQAQYDPTLKHLKLKYEPSTATEIINNGHSFQVGFADDTNKSTLSGGPVTGTYRLKQFHFHWGSRDDHGSEHTIGGIPFPCELHLVHWNTKYPSFSEASDKPDGLAVVGVFLKLGSANPSLQKVLDKLSAIQSKGKQAEFTNFDPKTLLPHHLHYWTYEGSLTTPPLCESVTWIVLKDAVSVSHAQMTIFRSLLFSTEEEAPKHMQDNFRPPQPLKGRVVRCNFK
ncbi:carbonic anhydrase [Electrophorus electricus]|nr:carbonic anhydrase [Electrophorus electricus]